jgi:GNAT superfamily N-acetyltransferase
MPVNCPAFTGLLPPIGRPTGKHLCRGRNDDRWMSKVVFRNVAECPEIHDTIARWLWSFWGSSLNLDFYRSLVTHCREDDFPMMYVAFVDDVPVGTVALLRADLFSRQDLFPWMADLYVCPEYRSHGIGSALQDFILRKAKDCGFRTVYLYTPLKEYYEKKGWEYMGDEMERDGEIVRIYAKKLD